MNDKTKINALSIAIEALEATKPRDAEHAKVILAAVDALREIRKEIIKKQRTIEMR